MADASHLERMGRELKCPICLSLFNSAVSLTCNHVFCNLCIEKSMKAASSCQAKSMEVASGVNIFVTQTEPSLALLSKMMAK
ncbi:hypothetical protein AAHA92_10691 [Salvia divinorum]|uniref:RING-type domain-containing protein n=1 Tax=Salvia divinorum TaxID=28513 RepID=A0ABD1HW89_SALDI